MAGKKSKKPLGGFGVARTSPGSSAEIVASVRRIANRNKVRIHRVALFASARASMMRTIQLARRMISADSAGSVKINAPALREDVSGMLVVEDDRGAIGYNSTHALVRQRFTIAHEIAHFLLHLKKNRKSQLFIDRFVFRRDENSSTGNDREEVQANRFGAALLMPARLVRKEIRKHELDLDDADAIDFLARRFLVSTAAMTNRLTTLGLLR